MTDFEIVFADLLSPLKGFVPYNISSRDPEGKMYIRNSSDNVGLINLDFSHSSCNGYVNFAVRIYGSSLIIWGTVEDSIIKVYTKSNHAKPFELDLRDPDYGTKRYKNLFVGAIIYELKTWKMQDFKEFSVADFRLFMKLLDFELTI